ncbi:MAG: roadblock/LC7 domain-containing protein [Candidatus Thorarchaeota archaeon]|jgi:predicted regulator of Ras-like GTPase activity (Roadblock/LC7/MglB family)
MITENENGIEPEPETEDENGIEPETENGIESETEIPPIKQIRNLLAEFEMRVPVWGLTVFTVDGYILAHRLFYDDMPDNIELAVSSMSAGLITISEDFIRLVDAKKSFRQVTVDAEDNSSAVSFSILLKNVSENVMMACIFPSNVQLGLVTFELENLSNEIVEIVNMWDVKLHEDTVT